MSVGYELRGSVALITIDRPQRRNAGDAGLCLPSRMAAERDLG